MRVQHHGDLSISHLHILFHLYRLPLFLLIPMEESIEEDGRRIWKRGKIRYEVSPLNKLNNSINSRPEEVRFTYCYTTRSNSRDERDAPATQG